MSDPNDSDDFSDDASDSIDCGKKIEDLDKEIKEALRHYKRRGKSLKAREDYVRKRNALYSQRKYYKKKLLIKELNKERKALEEKNGLVRSQNDSLEALLTWATEQVELHEKFAACPTAPKPPAIDTEKQLQLLARTLGTTVHPTRFCPDWQAGGGTARLRSPWEEECTSAPVRTNPETCPESGVGPNCDATLNTHYRCRREVGTRPAVIPAIATSAPVPTSAEAMADIFLREQLMMSLSAMQCRMPAPPPPGIMFPYMPNGYFPPYWMGGFNPAMMAPPVPNYADMIMQRQQMLFNAFATVGNSGVMPQPPSVANAPPVATMEHKTTTTTAAANTVVTPTMTGAVPVNPSVAVGATAFSNMPTLEEIQRIIAERQQASKATSGPQDSSSAAVLLALHQNRQQQQQQELQGGGTPFSVLPAVPASLAS